MKSKIRENKRKNWRLRIIVFQSFKSWKLKSHILIFFCRSDVLSALKCYCKGFIICRNFYLRNTWIFKTREDLIWDHIQLGFFGNEDILVKKFNFSVIFLRSFTYITIRNWWKIYTHSLKKVLWIFKFRTFNLTVIFLYLLVGILFVLFFHV